VVATMTEPSAAINATAPTFFNIQCPPFGTCSLS
jgi:hypothetical protein